jgi:cytochrome P450
MHSSNIPALDVDLYSAESRNDPYPNYHRIRDSAPVVFFPKYDCYGMGRFADVRDALLNWQIFSSAEGVAMNATMNSAIAGGTLGSDDPVHAHLRRIVGRPLTPTRLTEIRDRMYVEADVIVDRLVAQGSFDAATELAEHLPLTVVSELVGLPDEGRQRMLEWGAANFNCLGPSGTTLTEEAFPLVAEMVKYAYGCTRDRVKPDSWAAELFHAADQGEIPQSQVGALFNDYVGPSLDTTIYALSNAIYLFARFPEQWAALREEPGRLRNAINEVIRLESPAQFQSRLSVSEYRVGDCTLPTGSRVILLFASANRDERRWERPEELDITRRAADQLGFGYGVHTCLGANLARLELAAILQALLSRVERFEIVGAERAQNNVLRGFAHLQVMVRIARRR